MILLNCLIVTLILCSGAYCDSLYRLSQKCINGFKVSMVLNHNYYRSLHSTPGLKLNATINAKAQKYAEYLAFNNFFNHSRIKGYGENLAYTWSSAKPNLILCGVYGALFTKMWYNEILFYDFRKPGHSAKTGHLTQLIWRETTQVGCGLAISMSNKVYGVCNYYKMGNIIEPGYFMNNVLPLKT